MRARVAGASEEQECARLEHGVVGERAERDVAGACRRAVCQPVAGEIDRLFPCIDELDELVREGARDTCRELVVLFAS